MKKKECKTLVVFLEKSLQAGNIICSEIKNEEDITMAKKEIEKLYGHKPENTIILNLITLND